MGYKLLNRVIVVVEDNMIFIKSMAECLEQQGAKVHKCYDGKHGLKILNVVKPDLIITDITMPNMSGFEMIEELAKAEFSNKAPIIVITAADMKKQVEEAIRLGVDAYMIKPVDTNPFLDKIYEVLGIK